MRDVTVQRDLIATLSLVTPATLQALNVSVAQALAAALKDVASTIPAVLGHATMSRSTHKDWLLSTRISSRA